MVLVISSSVGRGHVLNVVLNNFVIMGWGPLNSNLEVDVYNLNL